MLARLQQGAFGLWLAALIAWVGGSLAQHHWSMAALGAVVMLTGHAAWLAVGFGLAHWVNREDPAPRATAADLLHAWWGEARTAPRVFFWQQPFRHGAEPDHLPGDAQGRVGVVLVHGFFCNRGLWNPWLARLHAEGVPFVAINLEPVLGSIDDYPVLIDEAVERLERATGEKPLLVGHSMGGLAIRAWLHACSADDRIRGVVTIGSPHQGTSLARLAVTENGQQMRVGSEWLERLSSAETASRRALFLCCFGHCDNIVFPASSACLAGAEHCHVPATAHVDLIHHPSVMAQVWGRLGRPFDAPHVQSR